MSSHPAWAAAEAARLDGPGEPGLWLGAAQALEGWIVPHEVAHARYRLSEALLRAGARAGAGDALRAAYRRATELGLGPLLEQLASLARRGRLDLGRRPRDESRATNQFGLSTREREVLGLLVAGRSNREIGEMLFISEKTASVHVTHILDKLGVSSRGAAAAFAAREGLIDLQVCR